MLRVIRKLLLSRLSSCLAFFAGAIITYVFFCSCHSEKSGVNNINLDESPKSNINKNWTLVRIIHQSWKSKRLPRRFANWSRTWRECFPEPEWQHLLWTDADNERFVADEYAWFLERYKSFRRNIYRVDSVRYLYMHRFGGIYSDLDNVCLRPFEHLLRGHNLVFGDIVHNVKPSPYWTYIQNSFMYSSPGHPFWLDLVRRISKLDADVDGLPEPLTGPVAMQEVLLENWKRYGGTLRSIHLKRLTRSVILLGSRHVTISTIWLTHSSPCVSNITLRTPTHMYSNSTLKHGTGEYLLINI